jgi:signal transduction histidine kinase
MQPRLSIRTKLFLAICLILLLSYSTLLYSTVITVNASLQTEIDKNLQANLKYARIQYLARSEQVISSLMQPLTSPVVPVKIAQRDIPWLQDAVQRWQKVLPFTEIVTIVDPDKRVLARVNGENVGAYLDLPGVLDEAFKWKKVIISTEIVPNTFLCNEGVTDACRKAANIGESLAIMIVIPVFTDDGTLVGGVISGDIINKEPHLPFQIKEVFGKDVEVTITQRGQRVASSLPENLPMDFLSPLILSRLSEKLPYQGEIVIGDKVYETVVEPINNSRGEFVGSLSVALSKESFKKLSRDNMANILASALLGIICSFGIAYVSARKLASPLRDLTRGVRMIEAGDLNQRLTVTSSDEFGMLADSFNRMAEALVERGGIINRKNQDLQELNEQLEKKVIERTSELSMEMGRLEAVLTSMAEGVVVTDRVNRVIIFNPAAQQIFDLVPFRVVGQPVDQVCEMGGFSLLIDYIKEIVHEGKNGGGDRQVDLEIKGKKLKINLVALLDEDGEFAGVLMSIRDVTVEEEVDRMKTEFISTVSHELKTPLTSMKGSLQLLLNRGKWLTETERQLLSVCLRNTQRLIRLISEILDISKIESGGVVFSFRPFSIGELVVYAEEEIKSFAMSMDVTIVNSIGDHLPLVFGDHDRLIQVMTNLLSNAVKFSPKGTVVMVSAEQTGSYITVSVSDRGKVIQWSDREKLFKKFQQIDNAEQQKLGGTGLGLAICKEIIERHHGKIYYSAGKETGNVFSFTVPIVEEDHGKRPDSNS